MNPNLSEDIIENETFNKLSEDVTCEDNSEGSTTKCRYLCTNCKLPFKGTKEYRKHIEETPVLSGHNRLKRHQALLYPHLELDEKCSKCKQKPETSWHLIADCPYFMSRRRDIFHVQDSLKENPEWEPSQIIDFINKIKFDSLNKGGDSSVSSGK